MCANNTRDHQLWFGLVAFVIGTVVLLERFDLVPAETWDYLWPSILVVSGLKLMLLCKTGSSSSCCESSCGSSCEMDKDSCNCAGDSCDEFEMPMVMPKKTSKKKTGKK